MSILRPRSGPFPLSSPIPSFCPTPRATELYNATGAGRQLPAARGAAGRRFVLLAALALLVPAAAPGQEAPGSAGRARRGSAAWVETTLRRMTLDEKLGQLLVVGYFGGFLSAESGAYRELMRMVERNHVGGFVVTTRGGLMGAERSQVYPTAVLANQLQRRARVPLLVAADLERGTAMRLVEGTSFPFPMHVAATDRVEDAYAMGRITALEARAAGIHCVFAPVADVNVNPDNPIINTRSFGEDPQRVAELVAAFVRGVERNGALATVKHFPGHGDTSTDSHIDLPTVTADRERLDRIELAPFRAAIAAGASTLMTGHLAVPALEPDPDVPATLSPLVLTDLLRRDLGFRGVVFTDAMDMGGVTQRYAPADAAVRAILAGSDLLLIPPVPDAAVAALKEAVASGRLPRARVDAAVRRVLRLKAQLGLHRQRLVNVEALNRAFARPEFARAADDIADRGMTLLRDEPRLLPLDPTRPQRLLLAIISGDADAFAGVDLEREVRGRVESVEVLRVDTRFARAELARVPPPESYDAAIVALLVRVADRKGTIGLPAEQRELVQRLLAAGRPTVVLSLGSPYLIARFPEAKTWLAAFSTQEVVQRAAARALFGQIPIGGKLPVSVPGVANRGAGLSVAANPMRLRAGAAEMETRLQPAFAVVEAAIRDAAFPGGVLAVGHQGAAVVRAFGRQGYAPDAPAVRPETRYDAASLTKVVVTTTAVAALAQAGRLGLDNPIVRHLPEFAAGPQPEWRRRVTLRDLLTHTSGLPTHKPYFLEARNKHELLAKIFAEPLEAEPGTRATYSDLGFLLLGEILERVTGRPLDALARDQIFAPLGMNDSGYRPPKRLRDRIAPTEDDPAFRRRVVHGEVHDENAWVAGGVAGHAGMFTTAGDLAVFCQMLLHGGLYAHQRILRRATLERFTARLEIAGTQRALGWAATRPGGFAGKYPSDRSFGHTGFTGTSVWIDPEKNLFVVLLTNRVHPTRKNEKIEAVRAAVHDAVVEALGLAAPGGPGKAEP